MVLPVTPKVELKVVAPVTARVLPILALVVIPKVLAVNLAPIVVVLISAELRPELCRYQVCN